MLNRVILIAGTVGQVLMVVGVLIVTVSLVYPAPYSELAAFIPVAIGMCITLVGIGLSLISTIAYYVSRIWLH